MISLLALATITLMTYIHFSYASLSYQSEVLKYYLYIFYGDGACIVLLAVCAWYQKAKLKLLPFSICLLLSMCYLAIVAINYAPTGASWQPVALFTQLLLNIFLLSGLWWLTVLTPPQQFVLLYYNNRQYRFWAWLALLMIYSEIGLELWVRSHYALFCHGPILCNWQSFTHLDINDIVNFWVSHAFHTADVTTQFRVYYHTLMFIILFYLGLLSLVLLCNHYLARTGIINLFAIAIKIVISFSNSEWLIKMVDYGILILFLLNAIAFISKLYPKMQSTGWQYPTIRF